MLPVKVHRNEISNFEGKNKGVLQLDNKKMGNTWMSPHKNQRCQNTNTNSKL